MNAITPGLTTIMILSTDYQCAQVSMDMGRYSI